MIESRIKCHSEKKRSCQRADMHVDGKKVIDCAQAILRKKYENLKITFLWRDLVPICQWHTAGNTETHAQSKKLVRDV